MITPIELKTTAQGISALYVEDDLDLRMNTVDLLSNFFDTIDSAANGLEGLELYRQKKYDLVLTDINMPVMNGLKMVQQIRSINSKQTIIGISAHDEAHYLLELINLGVDYFILKPLDIGQFLVVLDKAVRLSRFVKLENDYKAQLEETVAKRTHELSAALATVKELSQELVHRLTAAAELRDAETGMHNKRLGLYAPLLAQELGMPEHFIESIAFAAPLHDIGKIGIWDKILLKAGPLDEAEFEIMKTHTTIGAKILANSKFIKIRMMESISLTHHERWDGSGYPCGLKGEDIPMEGRIVAICDHYDALRSKRPYKPAFSHHRAVEVITKGDGRTQPGFFDPRVLGAFCRVADQFDCIFCNNQ